MCIASGLDPRTGAPFAAEGNTSDTYVPCADDQGGSTAGAASYRYASARVIIVSGPQGCGKSLAKDRLAAFFKAHGFKHDAVFDGDGAIWRYGEVLTAGLYLTNTDVVVIESLDIGNALVLHWDDVRKLIPQTEEERNEELRAWLVRVEKQLRPNRVAAIEALMKKQSLTSITLCPVAQREPFLTALTMMNREADLALGWSVPTDAISSIDDYQDAALNTWRGPLTETPWGLVHLLLQGTSEEGESVTHFGKSLRDDPETLKSLLAGGPWVLSEERRAAVKKELGDKLWYIAAIADFMGWKMSEIAQANVFKTRDRQERNAVKGDGDNR